MACSCKKNKVNTKTHEIELPKEKLPIEKEIYFATPETKPEIENILGITKNFFKKFSK